MFTCSQRNQIQKQKNKISQKDTVVLKPRERTVVNEQRERTVQDSKQESSELDTEKDSCTQSMRERADIQDYTKKGMSTENNTGIQTRAMAQRVDNEASPEQLQRPADPAMNPTVELHRTKEEAIKEFK